MKPRQVAQLGRTVVQNILKFMKTLQIDYMKNG